MGDQPFPTNPAAPVVDGALDGIFGIAIKMAENAIFASAPPWTSNPLSKFIIDQVIQFIANKVYRQFALMVSFQIIDYQIGAEVTDQKKALAALKAAQEKGSPDEIERALAAFQKTTVALTRFDGAAPPGHL